MINYSYSCAPPGSEAEYMCRISHGLQFSAAFYQVSFDWVRALWDYSVLSEKLQPCSTLNSYKKKKKSHRNQNSRYIKTLCEQRTEKKYTWMRKNSVGTLFLYLSLQILHIPEPCWKCEARLSVLSCHIHGSECRRNSFSSTSYL